MSNGKQVFSASNDCLKVGRTYQHGISVLGLRKAQVVGHEGTACTPSRRPRCVRCRKLCLRYFAFQSAVASSFGHSLGIYAATYDTINFDCSVDLYAAETSAGSATPTDLNRDRDRDRDRDRETRPERKKPANDTDAHVLAKAGSHILSQGRQSQGKSDVSKPKATPSGTHFLICVEAATKAMEETASILPQPTDKPIQLDMSSFLSETQKAQKDIDFINEVEGRERGR
jgi:hypothetical protein